MKRSRLEDTIAAMQRAAKFLDFGSTPGGPVGNAWRLPAVVSTTKAGAASVWVAEVRCDAAFDPTWLVDRGAALPAGLVVSIHTASRQCPRGEPPEQTAAGLWGRPGAGTVVAAGLAGLNVVQQAVMQAVAKWRKHNVDAAELPPQLLKPAEAATLAAMRRAIGPGDARLAVQFKFDGVRTLVRRDDDGRPRLTSRGRLAYSLPAIEAALAEIMAALPAPWALDGELYAHGVSLQRQSGAVRGGEDLPGMRLVVYDAVHPDELATPFGARWAMVQRYVAPRQNARVVVAETRVLADLATTTDAAVLAAAHSLMLEANALGMEGVVLRGVALGYQPGHNNLHSAYVLKVKPTMSGEFPIVGYGDGEGKNAGAVQWVLRAGAREFNIVPAQTYEERRAIFAALRADPTLFDRAYAGRPMTIEYAQLSDDGVPLQPRAIAIRDYE